jgi:hypothetical protein
LSAAQPQVEALEARQLLTGVGYLGGHLLPNVEVDAVYFGPDWTANPAYQQMAGQMNNFLSEITNSPYMDMLNEYGVGRGFLNGWDFTTDNWNLHNTWINGQYYTSIDDNDITSMLRGEIAAGNLPSPDANRLYMVYVAPSTVVTDTVAGVVHSNSVNNFTGYHSQSIDLFGTSFAYAVVVDPTGYPGSVPEGSASGLSTLQYDTRVSSHELAEATTDADFMGWMDRNPFSSTFTQEIGDIADSTLPVGQVDGYLGDGFLVQKEWSNLANTSILWGTNFNIDSSGTLYVNGDQEYWNNNDVFTVDQDAVGNITVTLNGAPVSFGPGVVNSIVIQGGTGNDVINIDSTTTAGVSVYLGDGTDTVNIAPLSENLSYIQNSVSIHGGAGTGSLNVFDQSNTAVGEWYQVNASTISRTGSAAITYSGLGSVIVDGGSGSAYFYTVDSTSTATTVNTGSSSGLVYVAALTNNLDDLPGPLTVQGNGSVGLRILDQSNPNLVLTQDTISGSSVTRLGQTIDAFGNPIVFHGASINYSGVSSLELDTGNLPTVVDVEGTTAATSVSAGPGTVAALVCSRSGNLDSIQGALTFNGNGFMPLSIDDHLNANIVLTQDTLTGSSLTRFAQSFNPLNGWPTFHTASIDYSGVGSVALNTGSFPTMIDVESTSAPTTLTPGPGTLLTQLSAQAENLNGIQGALTIAGAGNFPLIANDQNNTYAAAYTLSDSSFTRSGFGGLHYSGLSQIALVGGSHGNALTVTIAPVIKTAIDLGSGNNTLVGPHAANTWTITAANQGTLDSTLSFSDVENLVGSSDIDLFKFSGANPSLAGTISGTGSYSLNYVGYSGGPIAVNLQKHSASLIDGGAPGGLGSISSLTGNGRIGNTLTAANILNTWTITGANSGTLNSFQFGNIPHLIGGRGVDTFKFTPKGREVGINGGGAPAGQGDWLDYSALSTAITVNLATGSASNVNGGAAGAVAKIQNVISGSGVATLIGNSQGNILIGHGGADTITGGSGRSLLIGGSGASTVNGGSGGDILIGGRTSYDTTNHAALMAILAEWQSTDSYAVRTDAINDGTIGGHAGIELACGISVFDNPASNLEHLNGNASSSQLDWFFASAASQYSQLETGEIVNNDPN